jgi:hypothetical protein
MEPFQETQLVSELVVRGGVEPPTFRFSGGFAGPCRSTIGRLVGQDGAPPSPESKTVAKFPEPLLAVC